MTKTDLTVAAVLFGIVLGGSAIIMWAGPNAWKSRFCANIECSGNAPGECPMPPYCPPRHS